MVVETHAAVDEAVKLPLSANIPQRQDRAASTATRGEKGGTEYQYGAGQQFRAAVFHFALGFPSVGVLGTKGATPNDGFLASASQRFLLFDKLVEKHFTEAHDKTSCTSTLVSGHWHVGYADIVVGIDGCDYVVLYDDG